MKTIKTIKLSKKEQQQVMAYFKTAHAYRTSIKKLSVSAQNCENEGWGLIAKLKPEFDYKTKAIDFNHHTGELRLMDGSPTE